LLRHRSELLGPHDIGLDHGQIGPGLLGSGKQIDRIIIGWFFLAQTSSEDPEAAVNALRTDAAVPAGPGRFPDPCAAQCFTDQVGTSPLGKNANNFALRLPNVWIMDADRFRKNDGEQLTAI